VGRVESIDASVAAKDITVKPGDVMVAVDEKYYRPTEVDTLLGDPSNAKEKLGWETRVTLDEMIAEMVENDLQIASRNRLLIKSGYDVNQPFE
jgi:GDPmannose 4,6-dehydratase